MKYLGMILALLMLPLTGSINGNNFCKRVLFTHTNGLTNQPYTITNNLKQAVGTSFNDVNVVSNYTLDDMIDDQLNITNTTCRVYENSLKADKPNCANAPSLLLLSNDWSSVSSLLKKGSENILKNHDLYASLSSSGTLGRLVQTNNILNLSVQSDTITHLDPPVLKSPVNEASNEPLFPILYWEPTPYAVYYRIQLATDPDFNNLIEDRDSIPATYSQIYRLDQRARYFWRVSAQNDSLGSDWSEVWSFTTLSNESVTPILTYPPDGIKNQPLNVLCFWNGVEGATKYKIYVATTPDYQKLVVVDSTINASYTVRNLFNSTPYFWRVQAKINNKWGDYSSSGSFTTRLKPPKYISLEDEVSYPTHDDFARFTKADYKLVGMPGAANVPLDSMLIGTLGKAWVAYWDNGGSSNYLVKYDSTERFIFSLGRAFWIIKNGPLELKSTVEDAPTNMDGNVDVPLHLGWNMITNPYTDTVSWSEIKKINNIVGPLYAYDGTYHSSLNFSPYNGYYYFNETQEFILEIPPPPGAAGKLKKQRAEKNSYPVQFENSSQGWVINVQLKSNGVVDSLAWLGVSSEISSEPNKLDFHKPRNFGDAPSVYFAKPEWNKDYSTYASDIKPIFSSSEEWELNVYAPAWHKASIKLSSLKDIPKDYYVFLFDPLSGKWIDFSNRDTFEFTPVASLTIFKLIIGTKEAVKQKTSQSGATIITDYNLGNCYPDPFNSSTTFSVTLPVDSGVEVAIYNVIGQRIKTIYKGTLQAGTSWFTWSGRDEYNSITSSGIYFYRMTTNTGFSVSKKMVQIK